MDQQLEAMKQVDVDLKMIMSLFSFECANNFNCAKIINDPRAQDAFINNGLAPLLKQMQTLNVTDRIYAIEVFNEPEYMIGNTAITTV